jgi:hypothetical protein
MKGMGSRKKKNRDFEFDSEILLVEKYLLDMTAISPAVTPPLP